MYIMHVPPRQSTKWVPPQGDELITADSMYLSPGARGIRKADAAGMEGEQRREEVPEANERYGIQDVSNDEQARMGLGARGQSVY